MDTSLVALTDALKKVILQLKPHQQPLSFILVIGQTGQGKSALLRQSTFEHVTVTTEPSADIYYNTQGILLELNEAWLNHRNTLLQHTLKELNRCHRAVRVTGLMLTINANTLCELHPSEMAQMLKVQAQLLQRFGQALNHRIDTALVFTKLDGLAGFSEFFQQDHANELSKPLGFSLDWGMVKDKLANNYRARFDQLIHSLEQQVIHKMHPVRSSLKRTLIREFPLQLSAFRVAIQTLLTLIPPNECRVHAIYFTSAEQGGISVDHLNKKIQHEYALTVPDRFAQSTNYRAYFIEGAIKAFQRQTQRHPVRRLPRTQQWQVSALACTFGLSFAWITHHYIQSRQKLDDVTKELLAYDSGVQEGQDTSALYHLSKASTLLERLPTSLLPSSGVHQLKAMLQTNASTQMNQGFLPMMLETVEHTLLSPQESPAARYQALKVYLMLHEPSKRVPNEVITWFQAQWQQQASPEQLQKTLALLKQVLREPAQPIAINQQIVQDLRNYLNALPVQYLYYSLAKQHFTTETQPIEFKGFNLASSSVPRYFTKEGFQQTISTLPSIAATLMAENWILMRQDTSKLTDSLQEAYCYDYTMWWQHFLQKTTIKHIQTYQEARDLTHELDDANTINHFITFLQGQISPDFNQENSIFNRAIASQFTNLNLISHSAVRDLSHTIHELQPFLMTLAIVNDEGHSAFVLSKARFQGTELNNPLSALYAQAKQFPEPVSTWAKQFADDTWFLLMNDTKRFINAQWEKTVFQTYTQTIAKRYPFDSTQTTDVSMENFNRFFSNQGVLHHFVDEYLSPFLDTSQPQWQLKNKDGYVLPLSETTLSELIRANVITAMFFSKQYNKSRVNFSLQKLTLDPVVTHLSLALGQTTLRDTQNTDSFTHFAWPESNAKLMLSSIEGETYELDEKGPWAFFKLLQKMNVLSDEQDGSSLQILFEINGNSGRYLLKTDNQINPFTPGILSGFSLNQTVATS